MVRSASSRVSNNEARGPSFETRSRGRSSEPVKQYSPHPEELAKQASRRMDATYGLAAILRDARKSALLRMRSEIYFTTSKAGDQVFRGARDEIAKPPRTRYPQSRGEAVAQLS